MGSFPKREEKGEEGKRESCGEKEKGRKGVTAEPGRFE